MIPERNPLLKEIRLISCYTLRSKVVETLNKVPEGFWIKPASSSGKYHPGYSAGEEGLIRHTQAAVHFFNQLVGEFKDGEPKTSGAYPLTQEEYDAGVAALILHDSVKHGHKDGKWSQKDHPLLVEDYYTTDRDSQDEAVLGCIRSHMGRWYEPVPKTRLQQIVHLADYLASRKEILVPDTVFAQPLV